MSTKRRRYLSKYFIQHVARRQSFPVTARAPSILGSACAAVLIPDGCSYSGLHEGNGHDEGGGREKQQHPSTLHVMAAAAEVIGLYRAMQRSARKFSNYNVRE